LTKYYSVCCPSLYISIFDAPAYVWEEYQETKDYNVLIGLIKKPSINDIASLKNIFYNSNKYNKWLNSIKFIELVEKIYSEIVFHFPPENYLKQLELRRKIAIYKWKAESEGKRAYRTKAALLELQLKDNSSEKYKSNFYENCDAIGKNRHQIINPIKISIFDYRNYIKIDSKINGDIQRRLKGSKPVTNRNK